MLASNSNIRRMSPKSDESSSRTQQDERTIIDRLRSLFPAIEIKIEHVCIELLRGCCLLFTCLLSFLSLSLSLSKGRLSMGHETLPYGLSMTVSSMQSLFTSMTPSINAPDIDLMTLIYHLTYRNLRIQFYPIEKYTGVECEP
jgi:hypothetical protein